MLWLEREVVATLVSPTLDDQARSAMLGVVHKASHALALAGERPHQVLAQPAARSRDDGHAGRSRVGGHRNCLADAPDAYLSDAERR
jgi:hypothetical protein